MTNFPESDIERCKAAMTKPAPMEALRLIASGRVTVEMTEDRCDLYITRLDGRPVCDPEFPGRRMLLCGAWPLYRAGMIDEFCNVTDDGRKALDSDLDSDDPCPAT